MGRHQGRGDIYVRALVIRGSQLCTGSGVSLLNMLKNVNEAEGDGSKEHHFASDCGRTEGLEFCIRLWLLLIMKLTTELPC